MNITDIVYIRDVWMDYPKWAEELCEKFTIETGINVTVEQMLDENYKQVVIKERFLRERTGDLIADYIIKYDAFRKVDLI
ncbi:hypothetical protein ACRTGI_003053 [Clostridium perfringens]